MEDEDSKLFNRKLSVAMGTSHVTDDLEVLPESAGMVMSDGQFVILGGSSSKRKGWSQKNNNLFSEEIEEGLLIKHAFVFVEIKIRGKLLLSRKQRHFRRSRFSHCFTLYQQLPITRYQVRF